MIGGIKNGKEKTNLRPKVKDMGSEPKEWMVKASDQILRTEAALNSNAE
jgi:hypothetical protein